MIQFAYPAAINIYSLQYFPTKTSSEFGDLLASCPRHVRLQDGKSGKNHWFCRPISVGNTTKFEDKMGPGKVSCRKPSEICWKQLVIEKLTTRMRSSLDKNHWKYVKNGNWRFEMSTLARSEKLDRMKFGLWRLWFSDGGSSDCGRQAQIFPFGGTHKALVEFVQKWCYLYSRGKYDVLSNWIWRSLTKKSENPRLLWWCVVTDARSDTRVVASWDAIPGDH